MKPSASGMGRRRSGVSGERGVDVASLKESGRFGLETGRGLTFRASLRDIFLSAAVDRISFSRMKAGQFLAIRE